MYVPAIPLAIATIAIIEPRSGPGAAFNTDHLRSFADWHHVSRTNGTGFWLHHDHLRPGSLARRWAFAIGTMLVCLRSCSSRESLRRSSNSSTARRPGPFSVSSSCSAQPSCLEVQWSNGCGASWVSKEHGIESPCSGTVTSTRTRVVPQRMNQRTPGHTPGDHRRAVRTPPWPSQVITSPFPTQEPEWIRASRRTSDNGLISTVAHSTSTTA